MEQSKRNGKFKFAIDRGGTFTDIFAVLPNNSVTTYKLLSENPLAYSDAPFEGITRIINQYFSNLNPSKYEIAWIRMGTTLATNALLERKGARMALLITKGFKDALYIGTQARPNLFDLEIKMPDVLYEKVIEVDERLIITKADCQVPSKFFGTKNKSITSSINEEKFIVWNELDIPNLEKDIIDLKNSGIKSIAVVLMHSYSCDNHEKAIAEIIEKISLDSKIHVSLSNNVMSMVNLVPRGQTTCLDAYLTPCLKNYVDQFVKNIRELETNDGPNKEEGSKAIIHFMQSDGGLVDKDNFNGSRALLSGPAGGVIGYSKITYGNIEELGENQFNPVIGFDMGGTSTDVSRFDGYYEHVYDLVVAGIIVQCPQLDIQTVAAGGGSRLFFRKGLFVVGPESAGSNPGPKCYRKEGPLCLTDANVCLGRILPEYFPKLFGSDNDQSIDEISTNKAFDELTVEINKFYGNDKNNHMNREEVAMGFISVANETMCRTIRNITQAKGYETSKHILACFGSASGQHACAIARLLDISKVFIHKYSGILSAYGMALADITADYQEPVNLSFVCESYEKLDSKFKALETKCYSNLIKQNPNLSTECCEIEYVRYLQMTYEGTFCPIMCSNETNLSREPTNKEFVDIQFFKTVFLEKYKREFGFILPNRNIIVQNIRVRCTLKSSILETLNSTQFSEMTDTQNLKSADTYETLTKCYFQMDENEPKSIRALDTKVYKDSKLCAKSVIDGPAIIISSNGTILIEPDWSCTITCRLNLVLSKKMKPNLQQSDVMYKRKDKLVMKDINSKSVNPIKLSLFCHRFMSVAERMGRMLQLTAISTNIKERLDFSCAIFAPDGGLIANAPHIPVHLGSMQQAVKYQIDNFGSDIKVGDVILTNHPCAGGSHLPDLTIIKPYFEICSDPKLKSPLFWVASRGHHADIGGILPGSMPATSTHISQEGATFISFKIVEDGIFKEEETIKEFMKPAEYPGCTGARRINDNIADIKAQIASCQKGIELVNDLIKEYGRDEVLKYMNYIRVNAAQTVCQMLKNLRNRQDLIDRANILEFCPKRNIEEKGDIDYDFAMPVKEIDEDQLKANTDQNSKHLKLFAKDKMDDGTPIVLTVHVDTEQGTAVFDFTGTGYQVIGNCNTPKSITYSAILYCLRCMLGHDIPLNQGCLDPIEILIPEGSILHPSIESAVVGGNVQTSQRIVDVIFKAFQICAASQGCMNNVTFGVDDCVYYETIAGGSGAGSTFHGRSGVHTHMTNTRITDPETLERRFPVILKKFSIRKDSGGKGIFNGGDGVIREMIFRRTLHLSILTERRVLEPYGLKGGQNGKCGLNLIKKYENGVVVYLGSKASCQVNPGDTFLIMTPGGGGYGRT